MRGLLEFLLGETDLTHEAVQMLDQRGDDLAHARIGNIAVSVEHRGSDCVRVVDDHA